MNFLTSATILSATHWNTEHRRRDISLSDKLEKLRQEHKLVCIVIINGEGDLLSQVGDAPENEEFALYSPMVMETTRRMSQCGGFGEPICNGVILKQGRILITHESAAGDDVIYVSLLCLKSVPAGLLSLLNRITDLVKKDT